VVAMWIAACLLMCCALLVARRMHAAGFQCAGCGEWVETSVDESAGSKQQYVEDCQVCCQPNVLTVRWDGSAQEFTISAELES
jgi:Cysteine-rich CPXCG